MPNFDKSKFWFHGIPNLENIPQSSQEKYPEIFLSVKRAVLRGIRTHNHSLV